MGTNVHLTPELERFARECVTEGRYNNVSEVVRDALRRLQEAEERRRAFTKSLDDAVAEAERDGWISAEDVLAEMDRVIDELEQNRGAKPARRAKA
jgi:antitoxin ParD1/3/4